MRTSGGPTRLEPLRRYRGDRRPHLLGEKKASLRGKRHERVRFTHEKARAPLVVDLENSMAAVPVSRRRRDHALEVGFDLSDALEVLENALALDLDLVIVAQVLQMAPAARLESGALRLAAHGGRLDEALGTAEYHVLFLPHGGEFDLVPGSGIRNKNGPVLDECEAIAAVHDLLDFSEHGRDITARMRSRNIILRKCSSARSTCALPAERRRLYSSRT
jgi:hypothetical protein